MAKRSIEESTLVGIADAIREKYGSEDLILTEEMEDKIRGIKASAEPVLQEKSVSPTTSMQTVTADSGFDGLSVVTVEAVPEGSVAEPNITVSSSGVITATSVVKAGYVDGTDVTGTANLTTQAGKTITPSTSEQTAVESGRYTTGVVKVAAMPTGSVGNPTISVDSSTGVITATAAVDAGYVDGTDKAGTYNLTTKAAATITPGTSNQTIAAGTYLTGKQTIKGDANLAAENIKDGVSIFGVNGTMKASGLEFETVTQPYFTYIVASYADSSYSFTEQSNGYWQSSNKGVDGSYAICRVVLTVNKACDVVFNVINYAESNFDFGLFSYLDTQLIRSSEIDSNNVKQSYKGMSSSNVQTLTYADVSEGTHYIDVKFRKDGSDFDGNDTLQFKIQDPGNYTATQLTDSSREILEEAGAFVDQATPTISVSSSGLITASSSQDEGYVEGGVTSSRYQLTTKEGYWYTPSTGNVAVASAGDYIVNGPIVVYGDTNLIASNIKSGTSIFGVTGTYTGSGSSSSSSISTATVTINANSVITSVAYTRVSTNSLTSSFSSPNTTSMTLYSVAVGSCIGIAINSTSGINANSNASYKGAVAISGGVMEFWQINGDCTFVEVSG